MPRKEQVEAHIRALRAELAFAKTNAPARVKAIEAELARFEPRPQAPRRETAVKE